MVLSSRLPLSQAGGSTNPFPPPGPVQIMEKYSMETGPLAQLAYANQVAAFDDRAL